MKKMLIATLMCCSIGLLNASTPYLNNQANCEGIYSNSCANPCTYNACCESGNKFSLNVDFLWWNVYAENAGTTVTFIDNTAVLPVSNATTYRINYQWKPGYRIELGYETCLFGYNIDLFAKWTWFRTSAHRSFSDANTLGHAITVNDGFSTLSFSTADTVSYANSSSFLYERLDFGMMSDSYQIAFFSFKPTVAATFVHVRDSFNSDTSLLVDTTATRLVANTGKFSGAGITIGADVTYPLMQNMFLYSISEFTGLWGKVDLNTSAAAGGIFPLVGTGRNDFWAGRVILTQEFGFGYSACIWSFPVSAHIGWEFLYMPNFSIAPSIGIMDRTVNGLVAGVAVGF